jgi:FecR protein
MRRGCAKLRGLVVLALVLACPPRAIADAPIEIGRTILVVNDVQGRLGEEPPKRIVLNDDVLYQEDILTADEAETILEFRDGSTFELGPGAAVRIDAFVFNPDESVSHKAVSVGRGVFRYISGLTANQQDTKISTSNGVLAVRGSVVAGIVDPEVPIFIYVGEGSAVFTNDTGSTELRPGHSIAVPSRTTTVMRPEAMPPAIAAQAMQAIERRLPPRDVLRRRPPPDEAWLKRVGAANLLPVAEQRQRQASPSAPTPPLAVTGRSSIPAELKLLFEGHRRNLFDGAQAKRTPEQQAFIAAAARQIPAASMLMARIKTQAGALHRSGSLAGAHTVMTGLAAAAPSPEVMTRVASNAVRVNPAAAEVIQHVAPAAFRPPPARGGASARLGTRVPKTHASAARAAATQQPSAPHPVLAEPTRARAQRQRTAQRLTAAAPVREAVGRQLLAQAPPRKLSAHHEHR